MKVITETCRAHYIRYIRLYYLSCLLKRYLGVDPFIVYKYIYI